MNEWLPFLIPFIVLAACSTDGPPEEADFWKIEALLARYDSGDPQEATVALAEIARIAEGGGDSSIRPDVVLQYTHFRKHLVYDYIGEHDQAERAARLSYTNRKRELEDMGFYRVYHNTWFGVAWMDSGLPWIVSDLATLLEAYGQDDPDAALVAVTNSIALLEETERAFVQRKMILPIQYFRQYLIYAYLGEFDSASQALDQAIMHYYDFGTRDLDDEEVYDALLDSVFELDSHLPWLGEAEVAKLKKLRK